jgi:hypothetical protein
MKSLASLAILVPLAAIVLTAGAAPVAAQPSLSPLSPVSPTAEQSSRAEEKDPVTATLLSLGVTAAGYGLLYAAEHTDNATLAWTGVGVTLLGPSAGHIYAGENRHAIITTGVRTAAVAVAVAGVAMSLCFDSCNDNSNEDAGGALMLLGASAYVVTAVYDLYDAHRAAERTNRRNSAIVAPTLMATSSGPAPGVAYSGSF